VFGYQGKQVRDNIHSRDLVMAFWHVSQAPRVAEVYNIGGGPTSNCSMLEAIAMVERLTGRPMRWTYTDTNRAGDHIWWVSDIRKFRAHYPNWDLSCTLEGLIEEIYQEMTNRLARTANA
jgi:CDP-paratose 2-epimerase